MRKAIYTILFFSGMIIYGQDSSNLLSFDLSQIKPSPEASALKIYSDYPIDHYTGLTDINIPIYNLKIDEVEIPIRLSYHHSGIKVNQTASNVGLGWSFIANGVITRTVRGIVDEEQNGILDKSKNYGIYYPTLDDIDYSENGLDIYKSTPEKNYLIGVRDSQNDSESDIYTISSFELNASYILDEFGDAHFLNQNNLKIKKDIAKDLWRLKDTKGTTYEFSKKEYTSRISILFNSSPQEKDLSLPLVTGWYLTKIITSKGQIIDFNYSDNGNTVSFQANETVGYIPYAQLNGFESNIIKSFQQIETRYSTPVLNSIDFPNGKIQIKLANEPREDLPGLSYPIEFIEIKGDEFSKKIKLNYDYFISNDQRYPNGVSNCQRNCFKFKRLKLIEVQEFSQNVTIKKTPYKFFYNNSIQLPALDSFDQDYWGYFNGYNSNDKKEFKLIPAKNFLPNGHLLNFDYQGAYREPKFPEMKSWLLNKIIFPSGGSLELEYEPHSYFVDGSSSEIDKIGNFNNTYDNSTVVIENDLLQNVTYVKEFSIPGIPNTDATGEIKIDFSNISGGRRDHNVKIIKKATNKVIYNRSYSGDKKSFTEYLRLSSGEKYSLFITSNTAYPDFVNLKLVYTYKEIHDQLGKNKISGGLRIKSQTLSNAYGEIKKIKNYRYTKSFDSEKSSGIKKHRLIYNRVMSDNIRLPWSEETSGNSTYFNFDGNGLDIILENRGTEVYYSDPINGFGLTHGATIGYGRVEESSGKLLNNGIYNSLGYIEYIFNTPSENSYIEKNNLSGFINVLPSGALTYFKARQLWLSQPFYPYFNFPSKSWNEGLLTYKAWYSDKNTKLKDIKNFYSTNLNKKKIGDGLKVVKCPYIIDKDRHYENNLIYQGYSIYSDRMRLDSTRVIDYFKDLNISNLEKFSYNDYNLLYKIEKEDSENSIIENKFYYPFDFDDEVYRSMIEDNYLPLVQEISTRDNVLINKTIKTFELDDIISNLGYRRYNIKSVKTMRDEDDLTSAILYHLYDSYGNPIEVSKSDGPHIFYVWGYEGQYPIAKIENTTRAALETVLGDLEDVDESDLPLINGLRSSNTFKDAMITTYTYEPLVGMTSMTDPRGRKTMYEYDAYGRLESTRDADNYLLEEYKYHYRNQ